MTMRSPRRVMKFMSRQDLLSDAVAHRNVLDGHRHVTAAWRQSEDLKDDLTFPSS
jgi:hypothetical protein